MVKLRDHYFIAWLTTRGYEYTVNSKNEVLVNMSQDDYAKLKDEYNKDLKPVLKEVRKTVKILNTLTSTPIQEK